MPLPIVSAVPLDIPVAAFNADGLAVLAVPGGRYGGDWVVCFVADDVKCGEISTSAGAAKRVLLPDPGYPDRAIETAFAWLAGETRKHGWRVVGWECFNSRYGPAERPYFCLAQAIVASEAFVPAPGITYADETAPGVSMMR